jgi:hypothetical protein
MFLTRGYQKCGLGLNGNILGAKRGWKILRMLHEGFSVPTLQETPFEVFHVEWTPLRGPRRGDVLA